MKELSNSTVESKRLVLPQQAARDLVSAEIYTVFAVACWLFPSLPLQEIHFYGFVAVIRHSGVRTAPGSSGE